MKKKVFSVLLTVALATGVLAGCGSSAATGNNAATGAAQNEGSQTASATTAGEESGDTIVIRSCFATGMTGAVNRFAIEKGNPYFCKQRSRSTAVPEKRRTGPDRNR